MFAPAPAARRFGSCLALLALAFMPWLGHGPGGGGAAWAQDLLTLHGASLTSIKFSGATQGQDVRPRFDQRGVGIDGSFHAASTFPWALAANPFGEGTVPPARLGDVNLNTGSFNRLEVDLRLPTKGGLSWTIGRVWNLRQEDGGSSHASDGYQGINWFQTSQPEIAVVDLDSNVATLEEGDTVYIVYGADRYLTFVRDEEDSTYMWGVNGTAGMVEYIAGSPDVYVYHDQHWNRTYFFGFDTASGNADGQIWKIVDPAGNVAYAGHATTASTAAANGYSSKRIIYAYDPTDRQFRYAYSTHDSVVRLDSVIAETKTGGTWPTSGTGVVEVGRVEYTYYTGTDVNGDNGNLKTVAVTTPLSDSGVSLVATKYYRYYSFNGVETAYDATDNPGYPNALKLVLGPEATRLESGYATASDATLKPLSDAYFTYLSTDLRIESVFFNGQCGCGGTSANGVYELTYGAHSSYATYIANTTYNSGWASRTVVERPDGTFETFYHTETGDGLSRVVTNTDPSGSPSLTWATEVERNSSGRVIEVHSPANITAYAHGGGSPGTYTRSSGAGLVTVYERGTSGHHTGFVKSVQWKQGNTGTAYYNTVINYAEATKLVGSGSFTRPFYADVSTYKTEKDTTTLGTSGTDYDKTTFTKTMYGSPYEIVLKKFTTASPAVTTANNGSNAATETHRYVRKDGTTAFTQSATGVYSFMKYENGLLTTRIDDCQTNHASAFSPDDPSTDFGISETGTGSHITTSYTYDAQGRLNETTLPSARVTKNHYSKLADGRMVGISIPRYIAGTAAHGPLGYSVTNLAGRGEFQATLAVGSIALTGGSAVLIADWVDETSGDEFGALDAALAGASRAFFQNVSMSVYSEGGTKLTESRMYHEVPSSGYGSVGTNYDASFSGYDSMGRRCRSESADGTVSQTSFDTLGRAVESWIGTNDYGFPSGDSSGPSDMVKTSTTTYDGGSAGGNSYVTSRSLDADGDWGTSGDRRTTNFTNDLRGRVLVIENPQSPHVFMKYDNRGRGLATGLFSSIASISVPSDDPTTETTNRVGLSQTFYDERGQVWKSQRHNIDVSDGSDDDTLQTLTWYDAEGKRIKVDGESLEKFVYDRQNRVTNHFVLASVHASGGGAETAYADAADVAYDYVLEERQSYYLNSGAGAGQPLMHVTISRFDSDTSWTGALDDDTDLSLVDYSGSEIKGRAQVTAMFYDAWDRLEETAAYGTNGGTNLDRDSLTPPIARSDTVLVTTSVFDDAGRVYEVSDPRGIESRTLFDDAGRRTASIANYVNGTPSGATGDDDVFTRYVYDDGHMTQMWVDIDGDGTQDAGVDQVTVYTFGVPKGGAAGQSNIASNSLLYKVAYPDSASGTDLVTFAYNALGQEMWRKDQAGNIIQTDYDTAGRQTHRRATTITGDFDANAPRISTTFNSRGMTELVTQYTSATVGSGTVINEVKSTYDGWRNLIQSEQDRDSAVSGGGNQYTVSWAYAKAGGGGGRNTLRRTSITLPGSTTYDYSYGTASSINDNASRVYQIKTSGGTAVTTYSYNGVAQVVRTDLDVVDSFYDLDSGTANAYASLDRFDRTTQSAWVKTTGAGDKTFYTVSIEHDRGSNITSITDAIMKNGVSGPRSFDVEYTYNDRGQLLQADEGTYASGSISNRTRQENWTLDQVGNWDFYTKDSNGDLDFTDAGELYEDRTHNVVNELLARDTDDNGTDNYTFDYDAVGNMLSDGEKYKMVYNVWGQLVTVKNQSATVIAVYTYYGNGHRASAREDTDNDGDSDGSDVTRRFAYDDSWRIVATYLDTNANAKELFINHNAGLGGFGGAYSGIGGYIDHVVCRLVDRTNGIYGTPDGTLEVTEYYCQNWRADVAALLSVAGKMLERGKDSAYGLRFSSPSGDTDSDGDMDASDESNIGGGSYELRKDADLDGDFDAADVTHAKSITGSYQTLGWGVSSSAAIENRKTWAGYEKTGLDLLDVRNRFFHLPTGRWTKRDPLGYASGPNLLAYVNAKPLVRLDPSGLIGTDGPATSWPGTGVCGAEITGWLASRLDDNREDPRIFVPSTPPLLISPALLPNRTPIENWLDHIITPIFDRPADVDRTVDAIREFERLVRPGGKWDYKRTERDRFVTDGCPLGCPNTVTLCGTCLSSDVTGNINYGYVGRSMNIPISVLTLAPGIFQEGVPWPFDDPADTCAIEFGIALYDRLGEGVDSTVSFCSVFQQFKHCLNRNGTNDCAPCPLSVARF